MAENKTLLHEWFEEVWNQGHIEAVDRFMAPDAIGHGLPDAEGNDKQGPEAFKPFVAQFKQAFPDLRIEVEETVSQDDLLVARCVVRGTHTGAGLPIEATNRPIEISGMTMVRIKNGQIVEGWNNFDFQSLFAQLADEND